MPELIWTLTIPVRLTPETSSVPLRTSIWLKPVTLLAESSTTRSCESAKSKISRLPALDAVTLAFTLRARISATPGVISRTVMSTGLPLGEPVSVIEVALGALTTTCLSASIELTSTTTLASFVFTTPELAGTSNRLWLAETTLPATSVACTATALAPFRFGAKVPLAGTATAVFTDHAPLPAAVTTYVAPPMATCTLAPASAVPETTGRPPTMMGWLVIAATVRVSSV